MSTLATKQYVDEKASGGGGGGGSGLQYFKEKTSAISKSSPFSSGSSDQLMGTITLGDSYKPSTYNNVYLLFNLDVIFDVYRNGAEGKNYGSITVRFSPSDQYSMIEDIYLPVDYYWPASSGSTGSYPVRNRYSYNNLVKIQAGMVDQLFTNGIKIYASRNTLSNPDTSNSFYCNGKVHILYD